LPPPVLTKRGGGEGGAGREDGTRAGHVFTAFTVACCCLRGVLDTDAVALELCTVLELRSAPSRRLVVGHVETHEDRAPVEATARNTCSEDVQSRAEQDASVHPTRLRASTLPTTCSTICQHAKPRSASYTVCSAIVPLSCRFCVVSQPCLEPRRAPW
jgi:hypothetical protein